MKRELKIKWWISIPGDVTEPEAWRAGISHHTTTQSTEDKILATQNVRSWKLGLHIKFSIITPTMNQGVRGGKCLNCQNDKKLLSTQALDGEGGKDIKNHFHWELNNVLEHERSLNKFQRISI